MLFAVLQKEHGLATLQQHKKVIWAVGGLNVLKNIYYRHLDHVRTPIIYYAHSEPFICHSIHP